MMVARHMKEFGTTVEQMAHVSVKNYINAFHNPYAQKSQRITIQDVRNAPMVAWPLTRLDICVMSDGAAAVILASEEEIRRLEAARARIPRPLVRVTGIGRGTDAMRMADRPQVDYDTFMCEYATEQEKSPMRRMLITKKLWEKGTRSPGLHSFRAGRTAGNVAYKMAGVFDPLHELGFVEWHDAYTSSEIQTYEDLGLCGYGGRSFCRIGESVYAQH
ncbi:MAG: thiolase C-terminal domain-containing protein [Anaerolineae bacterium]